MTLILLAHGSRHPRANAGLEDLRAAVAELTGATTALAYLDLQKPALADVAQPGDTVVPLLFTNAFHARQDVPMAATGLEVRVTEPIGLGEDLAEILAGQVRFPSVVLYAVGSTVPGANDAVERLADRVAAITGAIVKVAFATCQPALAVGDAAQLIPLFVTHGLLLDRIRETDHEVPEPLGRLLAPVVAARYHS